MKVPRSMGTGSEVEEWLTKVAQASLLLIQTAPGSPDQTATYSAWQVTPTHLLKGPGAARTCSQCKFPV